MFKKFQTLLQILKNYKKIDFKNYHFQFRAPLAFCPPAVGRRGFFAFRQFMPRGCPNAKKPLRPTARRQKARGARKWKIIVADVSLFKEDFDKAGGFDVKIIGWGMEDVYLASNVVRKRF